MVHPIMCGLDGHDDDLCERACLLGRQHAQVVDGRRISESGDTRDVWSVLELFWKTGHLWS